MKCLILFKTRDAVKVPHYIWQLPKTKINGTMLLLEVSMFIHEEEKSNA